MVKRRYLNGTIVNASDAVRDMMRAMGLVGAYDVKAEGSRSTGYVGKPSDGVDVHVEVIIRPLDEVFGSEQQ